MSKKQPQPEATRAKVMKDSVCGACSKKVPKGSACVWIPGKGIYHEDCVEKEAV